MGNKENARLRLLVKVKIPNRNLKFESATEEDNNKLEKASEKIKQVWGDPNIPTEELWNYTASGGGALSIWIWGFDKFYKLFNPRQLLTLTKLVKLIRETGKKLEEEKIEEKWNKEDMFKYAEAVTTYLAIAICKFVYLNSIVNRWDGTWLKIGESMSERGISMNWNWIDAKPDNDFIGSWIKSLNAVLRGLSYLVSAVFTSSNKLKILPDDATTLGKLSGERVDVIVTDPPYYDDVPYTELSDFYFVWLKRALSDIGEGRLVPRFIPEAFFKKIGAKWVEIRTQWSESDIVRREVSLNPERLGVSLEKGKKYFLDLLSNSFRVMYNRLVDNGVLVSYYAHTDPSAWEALLEAGWHAGKFKVTNAFPLVTESSQRVTAKGKVALDTSIIVVWRKGLNGVNDADEIYRKALEIASKRATKLIEVNRFGADLFIGTMASVLSLYTRFKEVKGKRGRLSVSDLVKEYVYPATAIAIARALNRLVGAKGFRVFGEVKSSTGLFYLLCKVLFVRSPRAKRRIIDRSSFIILAIGARIDDRSLRDLKVVVKKDGKLHLMEPKGSDKYSVENLLRDRGISVSDPVLNNSVDVLHLLEYYAVSLPREAFREKLEWLRGEYPVLVEEALTIAGILAGILPKSDPEKNMCSQILERGGLVREDQSLITRFMS